MTTQNMIMAPKIGGAIDYANGGRLFHDAEQSWIAPGVPANGAGLLLSQIAAVFARANSLGHGSQGRSKPAGLFRGLLEQMKGEPLRRLPADPRELGEFGDQLLDGAHRSEGRWKGQRGNLAHLSLQHLCRPTLCLGYGGQHQVAEEVGVMVLEYRRIDRDGPHRTTTISRDLHHAAASRSLDGAVSQLGLELLQPPLDLLSELKKLLEICHAIG
jgi:hypothetical protein